MDRDGAALQNQGVEVRANSTVLVLRVVLAQFFVGLAGLLIVVTLITLNELSGEPILPGVLFGILFFVLLLADIVITAIVLLEPFRVNYVIRPGEIVIRSGLGNTHERLYKVDLVGTVEVDQSLLGKIFDYGTIRIYSSSMSELFSLVDVPRVHYYANLIEQQIVQPNAMQEKRTEIMSKERQK